MNRVRHLGTYAQSLTLLPTTRVTRLSNGLTIATESHKAALTCSFGVFVDAGSSLESVNSNGVAHFCEHLLFKGTSSCSQVDIEKLVENKGAHLNAYTSREITAYYANSLSKDLDSFVPLLADILLNSNLSKDSIEKERDVILRESIEVDKNKEEVVFDHLHAIAFQGSGLGMTILGPNKNIKSLTQADMKAYLQENYTPDRMVLSAAGGVDHDAFVKLAEMYFGSMKPGKGKKVVEKARFYGSDLRARYVLREMN